MPAVPGPATSTLTQLDFVYPQQWLWEYPLLRLSYFLEAAFRMDGSPVEGALLRGALLPDFRISCAAAAPSSQVLPVSGLICMFVFLYVHMCIKEYTHIQLGTDMVSACPRGPQLMPGSPCALASSLHILSLFKPACQVSYGMKL